MATIRIRTTIGEDRRLIIDLPPDTPTGPAELVIHPTVESHPPLTLEEARRKLSDAKFIMKFEDIAEDFVPLTPKERMRIGKLPPDARPSEELIDEDRGEY